jgi:hypothetical protein
MMEGRREKRQGWKRLVASVKTDRSDWPGGSMGSTSIPSFADFPYSFSSMRDYVLPLGCTYAENYSLCEWIVETTAPPTRGQLGAAAGEADPQAVQFSKGAIGFPGAYREGLVSKVRQPQPLLRLR